jgi:transcriptional regulator with GAF, ATPase, and Fis domain
MIEFNEILLNVWKEAGRHIEIVEFCATVSNMLTRRLPLEQVIVLEIDRERNQVELIAMGFPQGRPFSLEGKETLSPANFQALFAWCKRKGAELINLEDRENHPLRDILPNTWGSSILTGPLENARRPSGILLLLSKGKAKFESPHQAMLEVLLEPFSVALGNDRRLREISALREAAEADRRSLLSRLGRQKIGDTIVGEESGLRSVMKRVELVSRSDVPVLILGETGTGKELISRAIHGRSRRSSGPFLRVNCGAIPSELIDSQLFGHERGSFTGATERRKGWFERADGGTLFLDEIGELPLAAQVRLLRILQDGWMERVGGSQPIHVDVRILAATHQDLASMAAQGRFREDLYYRIAVFPILLPPLRDRVEDIPDLARHFAQRAAIRFGLPPLMPEEKDIHLLQSYPWPGNIRELGTVMDRAAILGDGHCLEIAKALGVGPDKEASSLPASAGTSPRTSPGASESLDTAIHRHIEQALRTSHGRIEGPRGAARILEINPNTLRARMRKLGIDWREFK